MNKGYLCLHRHLRSTHLSKGRVKQLCFGLETKTESWLRRNKRR